MPQAEPRLTVELERTGEVTDKILSYRLNSNYLTPADDWEFVVYSKEDPAALRRKWQPLRRVKLSIDGELQVIGRIDETEGVGTSGAALAVRGRDFIAELVDGGADPTLRFTEKMDLGDALLSLFRPYGIKSLVGSFNLTRNLLTGKRPVTGSIGTRDYREAKLEDFKPSPGMGAYECGDKIVSRHGFTIQSGGQRDTLAIVEPLFGQSPLYEINRPGDVLQASAKRCYADVPTVTIVTGRVKKKKLSAAERSSQAALLKAVRKEDGQESAKVPDTKLVPIFAEFPSFGKDAPNEIGKFDEVKRITLGDHPGAEIPEAWLTRIDWRENISPASGGILYRPMYYEDKDSRTEEQMVRGLRRELSRRLKDTLVYTCTLRGHRDPVTGAVWAIDTIAAVNDEIEDVHENMWILDRTFENSGKGPTTTLQLIRPGSIAL